MSEIEKKFQKVLFTFQQPSYNKPDCIEKKTQDYITWGNDNKYPQFLLDLFYGSSLNTGIINRKLGEIVGYGFYSQQDKRGLNTFLDTPNENGDTVNDVFYKCTLDYLIMGGFAIGVQYTKATNKISALYHKDISNLRFSVNQDQIKEAKDWNLQRVKCITYDLYNPEDPTGYKIFYYRGNMTRSVYPVPQYCGSLSAIQADILISDFWLSQIQNGLFPSVQVNFFDGMPTPEEQDAIEKKIQSKFGGNSNAGRAFITFNEPNQKGVEVTAIPEADLDKKFTALNDSIQSKIFMGHLLPPILLGVPTPGKLGATNEVEQASIQFRNNIVEPQQRILINIYNKILSANFAEPDLAIMPLKPINSGITDQVLIASQMTPEEIRKLAKRDGYIDSVELPEGQHVIGDIAAQPKPTDRKLLKPEVDPQEPMPTEDNVNNKP
jgi:hypothetical protein